MSASHEQERGCSGDIERPAKDERPVEIQGKPGEEVGGSTRPSPRSQSLWMSGGRLIAGVVTIAVPLVLVRALSQAEFGHYKALFLVAATVQMLLVGGIPDSLYYFVARQRAHGARYQAQSFWLLVTFGIAGGAIVYACSGLIDRLFDAELSRYVFFLALFVMLVIPGTLMPVAPMVDQRPRLAARLLVGLDIIRATSVVAVAVLTRDLYWIVVAACFAAAFNLAAVIWYLSAASADGMWRPKKRLVAEQLRYVVPYTGAVTVGFAWHKIHAYYVGASFPAEMFAVYAAATINIPLIDRLSQTIEEVVVLENASHYEAGRKEEMRRVWHRASHIIGLILIPVWLIGHVFAVELVTVVYGAAYAAAAPIFQVFILLLPLSIFLGSPMLRATGDTGVMVAADVAALMISLTVLVTFAGEHGPSAAVASLVAGKATYMLAAAGRTGRRLELKWRNLLPWGAVAGTIAVAGGAALMAEVSVDTVRLQGAAKLLVGGALASTLYGCGAWWTGLIPESEKLWVRERRGHVWRVLRGGTRSRRERDVSAVRSR